VRVLKSDSPGRLLDAFERRFARILTVLDPLSVPAHASLGRLGVHMRSERLNGRFRACGPWVNIIAPDLILGHEFIDIGSGVNVLPRCRWEVIWLGEDHPKPSLEIGAGTGAGYNFNIGCCNRVEIGKKVMFASNVLVTDAVHNYEDTESPIMVQGLRSGGPVIIEDGCWIGFGAVILPGVVVGTQSVVGAGSVVTRSIPAYSVAVGNPARVVRRYDPQTGTWKAVL
jgi:acetyltransferase-like isoleucine patch superfamily enzyme